MAQVTPARIPPRTLEDAPEAAKSALEKVVAKFGRVSTLAGGMANSPTMIQLYVHAKGAIAEYASFDPALQEAIALAVAAENGCEYCQSAHTWAAIRAGLTDQQTVAIRRGRVDWDEKLDVLLRAAREFVARKGDVTDETFEEALSRGWTLEDLTEMAAHCLANMITNYFNHLARTELDIKPAPRLEP